MTENEQLLDEFIEKQKALSRAGSGDDEFYAQQPENYINKQRAFILDLIKFVILAENKRVRLKEDERNVS